MKPKRTLLLFKQWELLYNLGSILTRMMAMDQNRVIDKLSAKVKLIRVENDYTQDRMATVLGISKKSLVQIEKRRVNANWTTTVALCALFRNSEVIQHTMGGDVLTILDTAAHTEADSIKL